MFKALLMNSRMFHLAGITLCVLTSLDAVWGSTGYRGDVESRSSRTSWYEGEEGVDGEGLIKLTASNLGKYINTFTVDSTPISKMGKGRGDVYLKGHLRKGGIVTFMAHFEEAHARLEGSGVVPDGRGMNLSGWLSAVFDYVSQSYLCIKGQYALYEETSGGKKTFMLTSPVKIPVEEEGRQDLEVRDVHVEETPRDTIVHVSTNLPEATFMYRCAHECHEDGEPKIQEGHLVIRDGALFTPAYREVRYTRLAVSGMDRWAETWSDLGLLSSRHELNTREPHHQPVGTLAFQMASLGETALAEEGGWLREFPTSTLHIESHGYGSSPYLYKSPVDGKVYGTLTHRVEASALYGDGARYGIRYTHATGMEVRFKEQSLWGLGTFPPGLYQVMGASGSGLQLQRVGEGYALEEDAWVDVKGFDALLVPASLRGDDLWEVLQGMRDIWRGPEDMRQATWVQAGPLGGEGRVPMPLAALPESLPPLSRAVFHASPLIPLPVSLVHLTLSGFSLDEELAAQVGGLSGITHLTLTHMTGTDRAFERAFGSLVLTHIDLTGSEGVGGLTLRRLGALAPRLATEAGGSFTPHDREEWSFLCGSASSMTPETLVRMQGYGDSDVLSAAGAKRRGDQKVREEKWERAVRCYGYALAKGLDDAGAAMALLLWEGKPGVAADPTRALSLWSDYGSVHDKVRAARIYLSGQADKGILANHDKAKAVYLDIVARGEALYESYTALTFIAQRAGKTDEAQMYFKQSIGASLGGSL